VDKVQRSGGSVTILRRGKPAAVIVSHQTYKEQIARDKPFRVAGSLRIRRGVDMDGILARSKRERIRSRAMRLKDRG
jgi:PHD/YefM family antitoxin component YafN of YafNO toxin-antitoxin module